MVPSSPSGRSDQRKANTNGKDLADSLRPSRPIHARAVQVGGEPSGLRLY